MKKTIGIVAVVITTLILSAAFIWTDFHISTSQTKIESQVNTYGFTGQTSEKLPPELPLQIYVEGDDLFSRALRDQLSKRLEAIPRFNQVSILNEISILGAQPQNSNPSILVVNSSESGHRWTPIYGRSQFTVNLIFASDGDISWRNDKVVRMNNAIAVQVVRISADFTVQDSTFGLISRIYYNRYLADQVATQIASSLSSSVEAQVNQ